MQQWFIWSLGLIVLLSLILFSGGPAQLNEEELVCLDKLGCPGTSQLSLKGIYYYGKQLRCSAVLYASKQETFEGETFTICGWNVCELLFREEINVKVIPSNVSLYTTA